MKYKPRKSIFLTSILNATLLLIGTTAIAIASGIAANNSAFKITSKITINGKLISAPVILAKENQKAVIVLSNTKNASAQYLRMELTARNSISEPYDAIEINYDIQYKDGKEKLHSKPKIIVAPNHEGKIQISDSIHTYELDVLAGRT